MYTVNSVSENTVGSEHSLQWRIILWVLWGLSWDLSFMKLRTVFPSLGAMLETLLLFLTYINNPLLVVLLNKYLLYHIEIETNSFRRERSFLYFISALLDTSIMFSKTLALCMNPLLLNSPKTPKWEKCWVLLLCRGGPLSQSGLIALHS